MNVDRIRKARLLAGAAMALVAATLLVFAARGQLSFAAFMNVVSLVLSWPVAAIIITLIVVSRFGSHLDMFFAELARMKLPGGVELERQRPAPLNASPSAGSDETRAATPAPAPVTTSSSRGGRTLGREPARADSGGSTSPDSEARLWKFRHLSTFYVWNTKTILNWFRSAELGDRSQYHAVWGPRIPDETQRAVILSVLRQADFLEEAGDRYYVTDEGNDFLDFIGIPPLGPYVKRSSADS